MPAAARSALPTAAPDTGPQPSACDAARVDLPRLRRAEATMKPAGTIATAAEMFRVLGDATRMRIVWALAHEELCVCDLAVLLGVSQSVVSHSLRPLRELRLVRHRRAGRIVYYALDDEHVRRIIREGIHHVEEAGSGS